MTPNNQSIFYAVFNPQITYSKDIIFLIFDTNRTLLEVNQLLFTESQDVLSWNGPTRIFEVLSLPRTSSKDISLPLAAIFKKSLNWLTKGHNGEKV